MNTKQANKLAMCQTVEGFLAKLLSSTTATSTFPALAVKHAALKTALAQIGATASLQDVPLGGSLANRDQVLNEMAAAAVAVAGPTLSYARTHRLPQLASQVAVALSTFDNVRRDRRPALAQRVHDAAQSVVGHLAEFGGSAGMLAELQAHIEAATTAVRLAREQAVGRKAATSTLAQLFAAVEALLGEIDPMFLPLRTSDPETYRHFQLARQILDRPGVRLARATPPPGPPPAEEQKAA